MERMTSFITRLRSSAALTRTKVRAGNSIRYSSLSSKDETNNIYIENLKKRKILKLSGPDVTPYLQGMVTNDVNLFGKKIEAVNKASCIYGLLLNSKGRVLYDCLIYKIANDEYLLEYDGAAVGYIKTHLDIYRLKKKVVTEPADELQVWAAYYANKNCEVPDNSSLSKYASELMKNKDIVIGTADPRTTCMGYRFITKQDVDLQKSLGNSKSSVHVSYNLLRYKLGIGEGVLDHPTGVCFPFETNIDFLNGVNFQKGCYIGQELTARVHFTGVIRKRLMPVKLESYGVPLPAFPPECPIINENDEKIGKLRSHLENHGLGLLNVENALKAKSLKLKDHDIKLTVCKPKWWPLSREKMKH